MSTGNTQNYGDGRGRTVTEESRQDDGAISPGTQCRGNHG